MRFERKLTADQARAVAERGRRGATQVRLAEQFGVSAHLVGQILRGQRYSDATGIYHAGPGGAKPQCCAGARCQRCLLNRVQARNVAEVRAFPAYVACLCCGQAVTRPIGTVLNTRGVARCRTCPTISLTDVKHQCAAGLPCEKCRLEKVREENLVLARATDVDVQCVACVSTITRQAGLVLDARGVIRCHKCNGGHK